jgi:phosphoglycolate phosphatase-like HAD superfamily hydrolase
MSDPAKALKELKKVKDFLIGIDSDGCAFDTMELKHKECFTPNTIKYWGLQAVSKYARETAEFVNLYSNGRGLNRFPALVQVFDLLAERTEIKKRDFKLPDITSLRKWITTETKLGNPALEKAANEKNDPILRTALEWSKAINDSITDMVHCVPPYPYVRESLIKMQDYAQVIVVSQTPGEALTREWAEHDIAKYLKVIAGQEMGTKGECLGLAKTAGGYEDDHVLMIGDAPGDLKAARVNKALFYPINPGNEDFSWQRFYEEGLGKFINGEFKGVYEEKLIAEFEKYLPTTPPWEKASH